MTIKWVQRDPLVMNGEPFCYGSRLTVRQLLELRSNGYDLTRILTDHPELRTVGIAAAYTFAANNRERYADFFEPDGSLAGPGYSEEEAADPAGAVPTARGRHQAGAGADARDELTDRHGTPLVSIVSPGACAGLQWARWYALRTHIPENAPA